MSQVSHGLYFHLTDMGLILRGNEWKFLKKFRDVDRDLKTARCSEWDGADVGIELSSGG